MNYSNKSEFFYWMCHHYIALAKLISDQKTYLLLGFEEKPFNKILESYVKTVFEIKENG